MIQASELRIGNLLLYKAEIIIVKMFSPNTVYYGDDKQQGIKFIEPIPLTEELLKRLGFECRLINNAFNEWYIMCTPPNYKREYALCFCFGELIDTPKDVCTSVRWHAWMASGDSHGFNIKYIHQLQNLFYALTDQELTLKESI